MTNEQWTETLKQLVQRWRVQAAAIVEDVNAGHAPVREADIAHGWEDCADDIEELLRRADVPT